MDEQYVCRIWCINVFILVVNDDQSQWVHHQIQWDPMRYVTEPGRFILSNLMALLFMYGLISVNTIYFKLINSVIIAEFIPFSLNRYSTVITVLTNLDQQCDDCLH